MAYDAANLDRDDGFASGNRPPAGIIATVSAGTTLADPEQYLARALRLDGATELKGTVAVREVSRTLTG